MKEALIVEDEAIISQGLSVLLEKVFGGFQVTVARSGEEGLACVRQRLPHLIITDIRMGGMDGLTFISKVRQITEEVPIIILSGHSDFDYVRTALRFGIADYLLKPVNRTELSESISKLFKSSENAKLETSKKVKKILKYIEDQLSQEITLKQIADHVDLHPQYIGQLFKSELDQTFTDYVKEERLKRAKKLLKESQLKVYEVAHLSGFKSPKHFMTIFKQEVNMTPIQYREFS